MASVIESRRRILLNTPHIVTPAPAKLHTFTTDMKAPLKECKINFSPVQDGTGDPSPDNVRPISGWNGIEVYRTGKNLFDADRVTPNKILNPTSGLPVDNNNYFVSDFIWLAAGIYYLSLDNNYTGDGNTTNRVYVYNDDQTFKAKLIDVTSHRDAFVKHKITLDTASWIRISLRLTDNNVVLESHNSTTIYEPYQGTTLPIDWTSEAGTVYGGYVDLVTGVLTVDTRMLTFDGDEAWRVWSTQKAYYVVVTESEYSDGTNPQEMCCDRFKWKGIYSTPPSTDQMVVGEFLTNASRNGSAGIWNRNISFKYDSDADNLTGFKAWIAQNPLHVTYKVKPQTYQLTPQTLKTLNGTNNIWSNANGDIDLKYWRH